MLFNLKLGINDTSSNIIRREAIRGIVFKNDSILMVRSNKGDYKFPGGGLNKGESHQETLIREIKEETGYQVNNIREKIGEITERKFDAYEENAIFEMISHYYICEISNEQIEQQLDDYELKLELLPEWVTVQQAVNINETLLKKEEDKNPWIERETIVLEKLKESLNT